MKIKAIFVSDWHFRDTNPKCRTDNYLLAQKNKLEQVKKIQFENDNCPIFDCGDLLDSYRSSPFLEGWLIDNLPNNYFTIAGNHDLPNHRSEDLDKSSLGVLYKARCFYYIGKQEFYGFNIYGFNYGDIFKEDKYKWLNEYLKDACDCIKKIAIIHEFISIDKFPGSITPKELVQKLQDFDYIFCGHNHINFQLQIGKTKVVNVGSMLRMDADQINYIPGFYVMYEDFTVGRILFEIQDNVIDRKYIDVKKQNDEKLNVFVESLNNKYEINNSFKNNLNNHINANSITDDVKEKIFNALD